MKKLLFILLFCLLFNQSANAMGLIFTQSTRPVGITCVRACDLCHLRCGCASSVNILWLFEFGDSGIDAAAKDGCIKQIIYADRTESTFFIFFRRLTTTVYGD